MKEENINIVTNENQFITTIEDSYSDEVRQIFRI